MPIEQLCADNSITATEKALNELCQPDKAMVSAWNLFQTDGAMSSLYHW